MTFTLDGPLTKISALSDANAEITAFDSASGRLFTVSGNSTFQIIDLQNLEEPALLDTVDLSGFGEGANSIAVKEGVVAIALEAEDGNDPGIVVFYSTDGNYLSDVQVGILPDMLTFSPDGSKVLVANEGEPTDESDPLGSISIIDVSGGVDLLTQDNVTTLDFTGFDGREAEFKAKGVRIFPDKSISEDLEPEYISVSPDGTTAWVTLQENNAVAVVNLETNEIEDLLPLGLQDHSAGQPTLETYELTDLPVLGTTEGGQDILLGGLSGLFYEGKDPDTGKLKFVTVPDRGPNGEPTDVDNDGENERPFALPDYQARIIRFELDPTTGEIDLQDPILLTREDGATPITGRPNIAGIDEAPVDLSGNLLDLDPFGADMEGIVVAEDGTFWTVDEYRPAIYHFDATGDLIQRYVPEGTAALAGEAVGTFGAETLPAEYANRRPNRGFEAIAYNAESDTIYAFIQTPLANPDRHASDGSDVIRILGIDTNTGAATEEYVYLLEDPDVRAGGRVDKIGDAVYDPETGKFFVIERDSAVGADAKKAIFEIDLTGATNLLDPNNIGISTPDQSMMVGLEGYGVKPVFTVGETIDGYTPPGILDGLGAYEKDKNTVRVVANHELTADAGYAYTLESGAELTGARVSFFDIDKDSKEVVDSGLAYDTIYNRAGEIVDEASDLESGGLNRLCSAQYFEAHQFGEGIGLEDGLFFTGEETSGGTEFVLDPETNELWAVPMMGRAAWESVTELNTGRTDRIALLIGDDRAGAPLYMYVGQKNAIGDGSLLDRNGLAQGKLYTWVADSGETQPEQFKGTFEGREGTWVEIDIYDPSRAGSAIDADGDGSLQDEPGYDALGYATQAQQDALAVAAGAFRFSRPEDVSTNPNDGTEAVLASTGRGSLFPSDDWGTTYKVNVDFNDIDAGDITARLDILYDGDDAGAGQFEGPDFGLRSPDNLDWADDGFIYLQEDRSTGNFGQTSGEEASIWRLDPNTGELTRIAQMNRSAVFPAGSTDGDPTDLGDWESSGIIDVSSLFGEAPGSLFLFDVQAHSIRDGIIEDENLVQGGQLSFLASTDLGLMDGETLEQKSADDLAALGIQSVNKIKVTNLPSIGYEAGDKPEGLALLEDGRLAVLNDNDFGLLDEEISVDGTVPLNPDPTPVVLGIIDLGTNNGLDTSDRDDAINIQNQPLFGLRQPDAIASFEVDGNTYFITANEGDARNEDERVKDLILDPDAFPDAATLQEDENMGRIQVSTIDGDLDQDGDYDQLFSYGSRSFTIFDSVGNIVYDSGDQFEKILANLTPDLFNANFEDDDLSEPPLPEEFADDSELFDKDGRSDNKGPEPESVIVQTIGDHIFAFIGLERAGGGVVVYDVTNPTAPEFVQYSRSEGDVAPEGLTFIPASESPNGRHTLVVSNEVSNTIGVFDFVPSVLPIYDIQGANHQSGYAGDTVTTTGIVTAVDFNGFYIQDPKGDGNAATSDGLFVFTGSTPSVEVGDEVQATGEVSEFIPGGAGTGNLSITQLFRPDVEVLSSGNPLPQAVLIGENGILPPSETVISADELPINLQTDRAVYNPETDAIDFYESLEGMQVTVEDAIAISPTHAFSQFSAEAFVLPNQGASVTPEDGLTARGTLNLNSGPDNTGDQNPEKLQLQFNPTLLPDGYGIPALNVGDQLGNVTGVVGYSFGNFEINVTAFGNSMMEGLEGYGVQPIFTVGEEIDGYFPPGILDGLGAFELDENTVRVVVNHELTADVGYAYTLANGTELTGARVSFFDINKETKEVVDAGLAYDTIYNRAGEIVDDPTDLEFMGINRLCSAQYFEAHQFGDGIGLEDGLYFTGEETGGGTEFVLDPETHELWAVPWMGRAAWESVTELNTGTPDKVALLIGDDRGGAPLLMYVGEKQASGNLLERNGLVGGKLYVWAADSGETSPEEFRGTFESRTGTWVEIDIHDENLAGTEGYDDLGFANQDTQDALSEAAGAFKFSRPEDVATNPNNGTEAVLASTGRGSLFPSDDWGTTYKVNVDFHDIDAGDMTATLDILYDGDDAGAGQFEGPDFGLRSPDNLDWADDGYIYLQEDRSTGDFGQTSGAEASIWKLDPETGELTRIAQMNRNAVRPMGVTDGDPTDIGDWESSGITDVSNLFDEDPGTLFLFDIQAHSLRDGVIESEGLVQGGQLSLLYAPDTGFEPSPVVEASTLEPEVTGLSAGENQLTVASYNVLNLDPNDDDSSADIANGQFDRLASQIVNNLATPDILAIQEIQDNSGSIDDGTLDADVTLQTLVDAIAAAGGPTYEFATLNPPTDGAFGGQPGGNIRNAFLYNPERVDLDESSLTLLTPDVLTEAGVSTPNAFEGSRAPLVASFDFNGNTVQVVNNHFSSRFGSTPIFGGPQPFIQAEELTREQQAQAIHDYVDSIVANDANANVIVAGDLNTFEFTNDIAEILSGTVLTNLVDQAKEDDDAYTFIFDGNAQVLDHILVTDNLAETAEFEVVHVNNDFARDDNLAVFEDTVASDHEPILSRFTLEPVEDIFTLQILHASDLEGGVDAIDRAPNFAAITDALEEAYENTVILSAGDNYLPGPFLGAASDGALREPLQAFYQELFGGAGLTNIREGGGRVDISIMNAIGFDASAIGNHEFDLGSAFFESVIEEDVRGGTLDDIRWLGAQFPYLSANLDFSGDGALGNLFTDEILRNTEFQLDPTAALVGTDVPKIAPSTLIEEGDELIGVIGATTQVLESISSPTGTVGTAGFVNNMPALAAVLQPQIDALIAAGTNKVILVSHLQQIALEQELIGLLSGVDVVIAGGSDTVLANADDTLRPGDIAADSYPIVTANADGDPAIIVSTNGEYSYVGQLVLDFNEAGILVDAEGNPLDAIDDFNPAEIGPVATTDESVLAVTGDATIEDAIASSTKATLIKNLTDAVEGVVIAQDGNVFGLTEVFLDGTRESVRTEETNFGNLSADANLAAAQAVDASVLVSLKNGGGIRAPIGETDADGTLLPPQENPLSGKAEGEISQLDISNTLRFNNGLTLLTLTAAQLKQVLEHGVAATEPGATPGQFPQVGGLSFSFDPSQTAIAFSRDADGTVTGVETEGERIQSLAILNPDNHIIDKVVENGVVVGDPNREIRIVTLNFLADGGDDYPLAEFGINRVDLVDEAAPLTGDATFAPDGSEQDALAEFLASNFPADTDPQTAAFVMTETKPANDLRIQNLAEREDTVLDREMVGSNTAPEAINDDYHVTFLDVSLSINVQDGVLGNDSDADGDTLTATLESSTQNGTLTFNEDGSFEYQPDLGFIGMDSFSYTAFDGTEPSTTATVTITVDLLPEAPAIAIAGTEDSEGLRGTNRPDYLLGLGGNDTLNGRRGRDTIAGNEGQDMIFGSRGNDLIDGGADNDILRGGQGRDTIFGSSGDDVLRGQRGNDLLLGGDGEDTLLGHSGRDTLAGGEGNDVIRGGTGADTFVLSPSDGIDFFADFFRGQDTIALTGGLTFGALSFESVGRLTNIFVEDELIAIVQRRGAGDLADQSNFIEF